MAIVVIAQEMEIKIRVKEWLLQMKRVHPKNGEQSQLEHKREANTLKVN